MARKTWRDLVWALAAALCGSLMPGCTRAVPPVVPAEPQASPVQGAMAAAESPYHGLPPPAAAQDSDAKPPRTGATLVSREPLPPGLPPDPLPPPSAVADKPSGGARLDPPAEEGAPARLPMPAAPPAEAKPPGEPTEPPLVEALRSFLDSRPADAVASLKTYDKDNQELLLLLLPVASRLTEGSVEKANAQEVAFFMEQVNAVLLAMRPRAALVIDKMCFCKWIQTFGVYEPTPDKPTYRPGDWAKVYVEVRNFSSEKREDAPGQTFYVTSLESSAEILDGRRNKVWPQGPGRQPLQRLGPDRSRTLRHDYFDNCYFKVPELPPGSYTLWIQVEDVATRRTARRSLDFDVRYAGS